MISVTQDESPGAGRLADVQIAIADVREFQRGRPGRMAAVLGDPLALISIGCDYFDAVVAFNRDPATVW